MIFVTVGTTHFDSLIKQTDELISNNKISNEVIFQIGSGIYTPKNAEYFRFKPSIDSHLNEAELVICHGGATVMSLLKLEKRFVAIANIELAGDHQTAFLSHLAKSVYFPWSRDVNNLENLITHALENPAPKIKLPHIADELKLRV